MGLLTKEAVCDNCGKDLSDEDAVEEDGHEFCSVDCRDSYEESHDHDDDEEEQDVCQFC